MYSLRKFHQQIELIRNYWFEQLTERFEIEIANDDREKHDSLPPEENWRSFDPGSIFSGRDCYYWLRFEVPVGTLKENDKYLINMGILSNQDNGQSIPEGLVFADGNVIQAVDANHRDIFLGQPYSDKTVTIAVCFWTGLGQSLLYPEPLYTYQDIRGGRFDETSYKCFRYLDVMAQTVAEFSDDEPLKYAYLQRMKQVVNLFDWGQITPDTFSLKTQEAMILINDFIKEHAGQKKQFTISAIGHTHIDVAWLWRLRHTREKTARSFATELSLLQDYPEYIFMHSTPQVYQYIKEDHPELFTKIANRIQEGRWEANGAAWVEPDMNIPSGEALTRHFLYGIDYFQRNFNAKQTVLWLPDVFGYSAALPQIMKNFGIVDFMTTKISWNDTNHMSHDTFHWQGIDGSEVLTYFITTVDQNYDFRSNKGFGATYNGLLTPHTVMGSYYMYQDKGLNADLLLCYGHGDGGGGPTREMVENVAIINELPGLPTVRPIRVDDYFENLHAHLEKSEEAVPKWVGELYLEYHRGTYTSQARVKMQNRRLETAIRRVELRCVEALVRKNLEYPVAEIHELWQILMRNQFHDILPGSSIREVYEDNTVEYREAFERLAELDRNTAMFMTEQTAWHYTLQNDLAWPVQSVVQIQQTEAGFFETEAGIRLESVRKDGEYLLETPIIPALGSEGIRFVPSDCSVEMMEPIKGVQEVENDCYRICWNENGCLTEIYDKLNCRQVLKGALGNQLTVYEDRPLDWDNWNIDEDYREKAVDLQVSDIEVSEDTPLRQIITFTYHFQQSIIRQKMILVKGSRRIDFETEVDWHEHNQLLRTSFTVDVQSDHGTYDIQYGNVTRPTHRNTSWDKARFESVGHKWADLSQSDYGVALLNDSKYGYDVQGQTLSLSLIKSGIWPDPDCDQGEHHFTYSLLPHVGDFVEGNVEVAASELNVGVHVLSSRCEEGSGLFTFTSNQPVAVDAIKLGEKGEVVILRFHDYSGKTGTVIVQPNFAFKNVCKTNLAESEASVLEVHEGQLEVSFTPYQIVTLAFELV